MQQQYFGRTEQIAFQEKEQMHVLETHLIVLGWAVHPDVCLLRTKLHQLCPANGCRTPLGRRERASMRTHSSGSHRGTARSG